MDWGTCDSTCTVSLIPIPTDWGTCWPPCMISLSPIPPQSSESLQSSMYELYLQPKPRLEPLAFTVLALRSMDWGTCSLT